MKKSIFFAYLWWILFVFIGGGVHRIYCGRFFSGFLQIVLYWLGIALKIVLIGYIFLGIWGIWWLIDAFLTAKIVEDFNAAQQGKISLEEEEKIKIIEKFYELYKEGKITQDEYEQKKNEILN